MRRLSAFLLLALASPAAAQWRPELATSAPRVVQVVDFPGATADVQLRSAITALPSTGGTVDARGYKGTIQTIAATVTISSAAKRVTVLFDPSTRFQPATASTTMFAIGDHAYVSQLNVDASNQPTYSANAIVNDGSAIIHDWVMTDVTVRLPSGATGSCLAVTVTSPSNSVIFTQTRNFMCYAGTAAPGIVWAISGNGFINANTLDAYVWSAQYALRWNIAGSLGAGGQISDNDVRINYEADSLATALAALYIAPRAGDAAAWRNHVQVNSYDQVGSTYAILVPDDAGIACANDVKIGAFNTAMSDGQAFSDTNGCYAPNMYWVWANGGQSLKSPVFNLDPGTAYAGHPSLNVFSRYAGGYNAQLRLRNFYTGGRSWVLRAGNDSSGGIGHGFEIYDETGGWPVLHADSNGGVAVKHTFITWTGTTPVSTGINVNAGTGGNTALLLVSENHDVGNATSSGLYLLRYGYDGNNYSATLIGGTNDAVFSLSGSTLMVAATAAGNNCKLTIIQ